MKKIVLSAAVFFLATTAFCQQEQKNGTIYIKHPYIDVVNQAMKAYMAKDDAANRQIYADTAHYWVSGMTKPISISDAIKMWDSDFDNYDNIKVTTVGYPDYLHYVDKDSKIVQSWWRWSGKSKKTGSVVNVDFVQFDEFNTAGKIAFEGIYGDFSKMAQP